MRVAHIPVPENTPAIERAEKVHGRLVKLVLLVVIVTAVGVGASLWFRFSDSAKQSTTQQAANSILASIERQDCSRSYSSDRTEITEKAAALERQSNIDFAGYLLSAPGISTATLQTNKAALEKANDAVLALPTLADMVDHGYTLNGVSHPPCPG
jgi:uncharacterized membrane protein